MAERVTRDLIEKIIESRSLEDAELSGLMEGFRQDEAVSGNRPDDRLERDPRDGAVVLYSSIRAKRPHETGPEQQDEQSAAAPADTGCPVCSGNTTSVIDVTPLSEGFTFINRNLFPALFPDEGAHFLQWSSNYHDKDWHNMPAGDRLLLLERLACLEKKLLGGNDRKIPGYVSIIKNKGGSVGGSLEHGHQQIGWSTVMPGAFSANLRFRQKQGVSFAEFMAEGNPPGLTVKNYGRGRLLVPYFMKRPYNLIYLPGDPEKRYLHELNADELSFTASAVGDALYCYHRLLPRLGKETAYNLVVHSGPGAGLYIEFLPYTQETGGFEHLGLWVCQGLPESCVETLSEMIG